MELIGDTDRQLNHINKKGRPVSQCPHCRGLRRSRASHVKCECGEKPHTKQECREGDTPHNIYSSSSTSTPEHGAADSKICCCTHGMRCTCASKKEHLGSIGELDGLDPLPPAKYPRKPVLASTRSENNLTVFKNHHHKPVHKHNHSVHDGGAPYQIPIPHSISGNKDLANKSVDSLPLIRPQEHAPSTIKDSIASAREDVRRVRSAHHSPDPSSAFRYSEVESGLPPLSLDLSYANYNSVASPVNDDYPLTPMKPSGQYYSLQNDEPLHSAGLNAPPFEWSSLGSDFMHGMFNPIYGQLRSFASYDNNVYSSALGASSSADVSEVGDYVSYRPPYIKQESARSHASDPADLASNPYRLSSNSYISMPTAESLSSIHHQEDSQIDFLDPTEDKRNATASPTSLEVLSASGSLDSEDFTKHGITVQQAQKLAHPGLSAAEANAKVGTPTKELGNLSLPTPAPTPDDNLVDPLWGTPYSGDDQYAPDSPPNVWDS